MILKVSWGAALLIIFSFYSNNVTKAHAGTSNAMSLKGGGGMVLAQDTGKQVTGDAGGSIIIIGASYAAGLKMEMLAGRPVINKGIGGEQSFETLARFDREVIAAKPEAVVLWGFINDIFRSDREKADAAVERIKASYKEMVDKARANGITPIVATEVTIGPRPGVLEWFKSLLPRMLGKTSYHEYVNGHIMRANQWLKAYAQEKGVVLLDLQELLAEGGIARKPKYSQQDGSHISDEGYRRIAEYIRANIKI